MRTLAEKIMILIFLSSLIACSGGEGEDGLSLPPSDNVFADVVPTPAAESETINDDQATLQQTSQSKRFRTYEVDCGIEKATREKKICRLPKEVSGRIVSVEALAQNGDHDCVIHKNYFITPNQRGLKVLRGCSGLFEVSLAKVKGKKFGDNKSWDGLEVTAMDFAYVEDLDFETKGVLVKAQNGLGVKGGVHAPDQVNHDPSTGKSQSLIIELPEDTVGFNLVISNLFPNEGGGERGRIHLLNSEKELMLTKDFSQETLKVYRRNRDSHVGQLKIRGILGAKYLVVSAISYGEEESKGSDSSDFFVKSLVTKTLKKVK